MCSDDLSPSLRRHVDGAFARPHILTAVSAFAAGLPAGSRVLDAGAGAAPFRELFGAARCHYTTSDWANSVHPEARVADVVAPIDELPLADGSFDAVLCTEVLEHVEDPPAALRELRRVLVPGGAVLITVPFVGELHEEPYDFFRFTPHSLRSLLLAAGFERVAVDPLGGAFTVGAHLTRNWVTLTGGAGPVARVVAPVLWRLGPVVAALDRFDRRRILTAGYAVRATAAGPAAGRPV